LVINTVKNVVRWVFEKILGFFSNLVSNMLASIARAWPMAKELVSSRANDTLQSTISSLLEYKNQFVTKLILDTMYTGTLPEEVYLRPVSLEDEMQHLEKLLKAIFYDAIFTGVLVCLLAVPNLTLFCIYCNLKIQLRKISTHKRLFLQKVAKREKNKYNKAKEEKQIENLRDTIIKAVAIK
jgi:hypothetical protein